MPRDKIMLDQMLVNQGSKSWGHMDEKYYPPALLIKCFSCGLRFVSIGII